MLKDILTLGIINGPMTGFYLECVSVLGILKWHQFLIHIRGLDLVKAQVQPIKWIHLNTFFKYERL